MNDELLDQLRDDLERHRARMPDPNQVLYELSRFRERYGPEVLSDMDGERLLHWMHGRLHSESRCLAYWLEFKDDDEFHGQWYGGIGGGSALKFGLYQRADGAWISGSPQRQSVIGIKEAVRIARMQRDELVAGWSTLSTWGPWPQDEAARSLQLHMTASAPELANKGWAHKYWFLLEPTRLDCSHSAMWQRYHLLRLGEMPPDRVGIAFSPNAGRFECVGRFIALGNELHATQVELNRLLNERHGPLHAYWRIGTTEGNSGTSQWAEMLRGSYVSIGWNHLGDLSEYLPLKDPELRELVQARLGGIYPDRNVQSRKAGEIVAFVNRIAEGDMVVACEGQTVRGIGRVTGPYRHSGGRGFAHRRDVQWLNIGDWAMPAVEGPRTTVYQLGRQAQNILAIENRLDSPQGEPPIQPTSLLRDVDAPVVPVLPPLPPLAPEVAQVDSLLRRKGQVILYGPPGTGKTRRAMASARELAAREVLGRPWASLTSEQQEGLLGPKGHIRTCAFHPGWGYEHFVEGLQPKLIDGQMVFRPEDGLFKRLCADARDRPGSPYFLVMDEINRADLPRVFGELLTALEMDKRGTAIELPLTGERWSVPANVFLLGTMNTADRSISLLDTALRRRFGFIELMPDSSTLRGRRVGDIALGPWLDALNERLRRHLQRDARNLQVGHAYLLSPAPVSSAPEFAAVLREDIVPLLEEYCYEDYSTLEQILGKGLVDKERARVRSELFEPDRGVELLSALAFEEMDRFAIYEPSDDDPEEVVEGESGSDEDPDGDAN